MHGHVEPVRHGRAAPEPAPGAHPDLGDAAEPRRHLQLGRLHLHVRGVRVVAAGETDDRGALPRLSTATRCLLAPMPRARPVRGDMSVVTRDIGDDVQDAFLHHGAGRVLAGRDAHAERERPVRQPRFQR